MLKEIKNVRQIEGEPERRWFESGYFDLLVWQDKSGNIVGFQLCYDKQQNQRAITWNIKTQYTHDRVDDGENASVGYKATSILQTDCKFDKETIAAFFQEQSGDIDREVAEFIYQKIMEYCMSKSRV
jgi:hypothetical protein